MKGNARSMFGVVTGGDFINQARFMGSQRFAGVSIPRTGARKSPLSRAAQGHFSGSVPGWSFAPQQVID
ncbi:hypothetical protein ZHAS_00012299 [Anopheles sinensis]|uniref:Uncharacterized protein n=1 Tax=Anopheles sinensis TaxID=74873 RepID=A0A084W2B5_ANOSI|nr:hypothetical protein ZHAS_00012299 [Anopheles sinensis]